jgi:hypothetical protein
MRNNIPHTQNADGLAGRTASTNPQRWKKFLLTATLAAFAVQSATAAVPNLTNTDVGFPSLPGSMQVTTENGDKVYTIVGGGDDIWGSSDNFHFAYFPVTGNFDYVVRVRSLEGPDAWTKAELMAREDNGSGFPDGGDRHISQMTTRTGGQNQIAIQWRHTANGGSAWPPDVGMSQPTIRPTYPNTWLRLRRDGDVFINYASTDGVTWTEMTRLDSSTLAGGAFANRLLLGLAVTAHNDSDPNGATAVFSNFAPHVAVPIAITTQPSATVAISANSPLELTVAATGDPISYQWRKDGVAIPGATSATYRVDLAQTSDSGSYTVRVYGANEVISSASVVTVTQDTTPPTVESARPDASFTAVTVTYSEPVGPSAETLANYAINSGVTVSSVTRLDPYTVRLNTSRLAAGADYILTINNVRDTANNAIAANTAVNVKSFILAAGVALYERWHNENGQNYNIDQFADAIVAGIRPPDHVALVTQFGGPWGVRDNYSARVSGLFIPPSNGNYVFFVGADDQAIVYLSTDDNPANKKMIARERNWSNQYQFTTSGGGSSLDDKRSDAFWESEWPTPTIITLQAGRQYYMEVLWDEGGGGDGADVTFKRDTEDDPTNNSAGMRMRGNVIGAFLDPSGASITFSQQPQTQTAPANAILTLTAAATGTSAYGTNVTFQWQRAPAGSSTFTNIEGATTASYTTPVLTLADNGAQYRLAASVPTLTVNSDVATITVVQDDVPPTIVSTAGNATFDTITVTFSEPVADPAATVAANYTLSGGITVSSVTRVNPSTVRLTTSRQAEDTAYTLTVQNVRDNAGNVVAANTTGAYRSWAFLSGKATWDFWGDIGGTALQALRDDPRFPNNPDRSELRDAFEAPIDTADNFGARVSGWVIPQTTGNYVFFLSADDNAELYLSTDASPANKKLIATEPQWNGARAWVTTDRRPNGENRSDLFPDTQWPTGNTISLTAGQKYYAEILYKEGGGGDNGGMTWKLASQPDPAGGSPALSGDVIGTYAPPAPVTAPEFTSVARQGNNMVIAWGSGTLESADTILGPWTPVQGANSPATIPTTGSQKFYRLR